MNYILSFCKITGASRIFTRNFYLPLLKPQTPKDALRTFKITGKWLLGPKIQRYIPVLFNHKRKRSKKAKDYGQVQHVPMKGYNYLTPVLDPDNENHKMLGDVLKTKSNGGKFVYTIEHKKNNLVLAAEYELAIRNGDIIDVLISQTNNKILIKLKNFKKIPVELQTYTPDGPLYNGEGETSEEEEKFHHHGKYTMSLAQIFEAKERELDEWEIELMNIISKRKKQHGEGTVEWNDMVSESIQNLDWKKFEVDAKKVIATIFEPVSEEHIGMEVEDFEITKNVSERIMKNGPEAINQLPTMTEIPEIIKCMGNATPCEIEASDNEDKTKCSVSGVKVTLSSGKECFIAGQMIKTDDGEVFVPGQTVENEFGLEYAPGITINMNNKPTLITGLIMGDDDKQKPMFLPTDSTITADGQLTFTTNPEERPKPVPKISSQENGIYNEEPKPKKVKKKKVKKVVKNDAEVQKEQKTEEKEEPQVIAEDTQVTLINANCIETEPAVEISKENLEVEEMKEMQNESERLDMKRIDDGMDEVIENVEKKKFSLQQKLEELRKLTICLEDDSVTYVNLADANEVSLTITGDEDKVYKLSEILLTLTRRASVFRERNSINVQNISNPTMIYGTTFVTEADERFFKCSETLKITLKSAVVAANNIFKKRPRDQALVLNAMGQILCEIVKDNDFLLEELCTLMNTPADRNEICTSIFKELTQIVRENKIETLKSAINLIGKEDDSVIVDKMLEVLERDGDIMSPPFKKICKVCPDFVYTVIEYAKDEIDHVKTEVASIESLQACIIYAIKELAEESLEEFVLNSQDYEVKDFVAEAVGLAKALGLQEVSENLMALMLESQVSIMASDSASLDLLKRLIIIRKLAERDYSLKTALQRIKKNPDCGRADPRIRQLVRESAALISHPNPIKNSKEIPLKLFQTQNFLAIEDYLIQRSRVDHPILISRKGIQAVVPKEAARGVLAGRVPYILIDESGVTNFKPMHMFSALKLHKSRERRIENYPCIGGHGRALEYEPKMRQETRAYSLSPAKRTPSEVRNRVRRMSVNNRMVA